MIVLVVLCACAFLVAVIAWVEMDRRRDREAESLLTMSLIERDDPR